MSDEKYCFVLARAIGNAMCEQMALLLKIERAKQLPEEFSQRYWQLVDRSMKIVDPILLQKETMQ